MNRPPFAQGQKVRCVEALSKFGQEVGDTCTAGLWFARAPGFQIIDGRLCRVSRFATIPETER